MIIMNSLIEKINTVQKVLLFLKASGVEHWIVFKNLKHLLKVLGTNSIFNEIPIPKMRLNNTGGKAEKIVLRHSITSSLFTMIYRLTILFGVTVSGFYLYQIWFNMKQKLQRLENEKSEFINELKIIRLEINKLVEDMKKQDVKLNQEKILKELNSLKAIYMSKQFFDDKQSEKISIPSWQLSRPQTKVANHIKSELTVDNSKISNCNDAQLLSRTHVNVSEPSTIAIQNSKNDDDSNK